MVAKANADLNQVSLNVAHGGIPKGSDAAFDIVIANILTVVLVKLMPDLTRSLKPGGILVLSGLLVEDEEQIMEAATPHGLKLIKRSSERGWGCLELELGHGA
jgi:ribosomal protein L11 methyltransferase